MTRNNNKQWVRPKESTKMDLQVRIDVPIKELFKQSKQINFNPAYQRAYIAKDNRDWQRKLITNIIEHQAIIPPIYTRVSDAVMSFQFDHLQNLNSDLTQKVLEETTEMIDGQQRTLTIRDFMNDEFRLGVCRLVTLKEVGNKTIKINRTLDDFTYSEIKTQYPEVADKFDNHLMSMICSYSEDEDLIHQMFLDLNDLNNMTAQEKRNAINSKCSEYVRNTSRLEPHPLFEVKDNFKGEWLNLTFKKMIQDEALAKALSIHNEIAYSNGIAKKALDDMYKATHYQTKFGDEKSMNKLLDTIYKVLEDSAYNTIPWKKTPTPYYSMINLGVFLNLVMVVDNVIKEKIKITDWGQFGDWFFNKHNEFSIVTSEMKKHNIEETNYHQKTRLGSNANDLKEFRLKPFMDALDEIL